MENKMYKKFGLMMFTSFVVMYLLMYINITEWAHWSIATTRIYMSICMISVMAIVMLLFMLSMYKNKIINAIILVGATAAFIISFTMLRNQTAVSDIAWMRGMIPHHSSAIMTSENAHLKDPEAQKLANEIIEAQKREIAEMKKMINRLEHNK